MTLASFQSLPLASSPPNAQALPAALNAAIDTAASSTFLYIRLPPIRCFGPVLDPVPHAVGVPRFPIAGRRPPARDEPRVRGSRRADQLYADFVPEYPACLRINGTVWIQWLSDTALCVAKCRRHAMTMTS